MQTGEFKVRFLKRATLELSDNENISPWEPFRSATVQIEKDIINLDGKWRVSSLGNFLSGGILGELLIRHYS